MVDEIDDVAADSLSTEEAKRVYEAFPDLRHRCPTCSGRQKYQLHGVEQECNCERQISLHKHYSAAGIGLDYQRLDWSDWKGRDEVVHQVGDYLLNYERYLDRGVGLMFWGDVGTGKTFLLNMVAKELVKRRVRVYHSLFATMVEAFTAGWRDNADKRWFERKFLYSDALFLDDLGKEYANNRLSPTTFDMILRTRDQNSRATFLTSNLHTQQVTFSYGASVMSMLRGRNILVEVPGADYRDVNYQIIHTEVRTGETRPIV